MDDPSQATPPCLWNSRHAILVQRIQPVLFALLDGFHRRNRFPGSDPRDWSACSGRLLVFPQCLTPRPLGSASDLQEYCTMFLDQPEVVPMLMPRASLHGALKAAARWPSAGSRG